MVKIKFILGIFFLVFGLILSITGGVFLGFFFWAATTIYGPGDSYIRAYFGSFISFISLLVVGITLFILGITFLIINNRSK